MCVPQSRPRIQLRNDVTLIHQHLLEYFRTSYIALEIAVIANCCPCPGVCLIGNDSFLPIHSIDLPCCLCVVVFKLRTIDASDLAIVDHKWMVLPNMGLP